MKIEKSFFSTLLAIFLTLSAPAIADQEDRPEHLKAALELWKLVSPPDRANLLDNIPFFPATGETAPLASYKTDKEKGGHIEIGMNLRQYRREYVVLSSDQDMSEKPDFEQYMAVMTALSISNESAHALQDRDGSLADFYNSYRSGKLGKACALYALQQHVSDVVMLQFASQTELFFLGHGSTKGLNALRIALEKNDLRSEYEEFRESLKANDPARLNNVLSLIKEKRAAANMASLKFCGTEKGEATLDPTIIQRATAPAAPLLKSPQTSSLGWFSNLLSTPKQAAPTSRKQLNP